MMEKFSTIQGRVSVGGIVDVITEPKTIIVIANTKLKADARIFYQGYIGFFKEIAGSYTDLLRNVPVTELDLDFDDDGPYIRIYVEDEDVLAASHVSNISSDTVTVPVTVTISEPEVADEIPAENNAAEPIDVISQQEQRDPDRWEEKVLAALANNIKNRTLHIAHDINEYRHMDHCNDSAHAYLDQPYNETHCMYLCNWALIDPSIKSDSLYDRYKMFEYMVEHGITDRLDYPEQDFIHVHLDMLDIDDDTIRNLDTPFYAEWVDSLVYVLANVAINDPGSLYIANTMSEFNAKIKSGEGAGGFIGSTGDIYVCPGIVEQLISKEHKDKGQGLVMVCRRLDSLGLIDVGAYEYYMEVRPASNHSFYRLKKTKMKEYLKVVK